MTDKEFEQLKDCPSTMDILRWIIKEYKTNGVSKRNLLNIVKDLYRSVQ